MMQKTQWVQGKSNRWYLITVDDEEIRAEISKPAEDVYMYSHRRFYTLEGAKRAAEFAVSGMKQVEAEVVGSNFDFDEDRIDHIGQNGALGLHYSPEGDNSND